MRTTILLPIIALIFLSSCETDVTDKVRTDAYNSASAVSISGAITDIDSAGTYVDVRLSNPYLDNGAFTGIEGATVTIYDGDTLLGTLAEQNNGSYSDTSIRSIIGHSYRLEVVVPDSYGEAAGTWESTLDYCNEPFTLLSPNPAVPPGLFPILEGDSTYYDYRVDDTVYYADADSAFYSPYQFFFDPLGEGNAYWVKSYATTKVYAPNGLAGPFTAQETEFSLASSINIYNDEQFIEGPNIGRLNFIGPPYTVYRDTLINIVYETRTISMQLFDYLTIMAGNVNNGGLFSVPYSPQIGNIRRQDDTTAFGLGYFYATSVRFDSVTMFHPF